jgi:uncharacterized membrane protein YeaQ/YmgE (transglycosylase-associated protein family)
MTMTFVGFVVLLVVAGICGAIGQAIVGYSHAGLLGSIAIGFVGALIGAWLSRQFGWPEILTVRVGGEAFPVVWSIAGSALFVAVLALLTGRRRRVAYG